VVHGTDECCSPALAASAILTIGAVLPASAVPVLALSLSLILIVLRVPAEIPLASPLLPVARIVRMVGCIIHFDFLPLFLVLPGSGT
jgi:hypothetical protein